MKHKRHFQMVLTTLEIYHDDSFISLSSCSRIAPFVLHKKLALLIQYQSFIFLLRIPTKTVPLNVSRGKMEWMMKCVSEELSFDADRKEIMINYCHYFEPNFFFCLSHGAQKQLSGTTKDTELFTMYRSTWIISQRECCMWELRDDGSQLHSYLKFFLQRFLAVRMSALLRGYEAQGEWSWELLPKDQLNTMSSSVCFLLLFIYCELSEMKMTSWQGDIEQEFVVFQLVSVHNAEHCDKPTQSSVSLMSGIVA